ncbi:C-C motif chemokine 4 homolog isoform X2 [Colossoma macropomum]|uniref:C-C motif chemokine 4 homolog isoform X2 n=1 Tax=Colossoma macropomum TaxID=42526 RepID=UPI00186405A3|nr:C-C motif chemokine 4 homolog isoform X2 [Colossoma macropomum]
MIVRPRSLLLGLLVILYLQSCAVGQHVNAPEECCFTFYPRRIPVAVISKFEETRAECPKPGLIFTTVKGARVCADPDSMWVQKALNKIKRQIVESST